MSDRENFRAELERKKILLAQKKEERERRLRALENNLPQPSQDVSTDGNNAIHETGNDADAVLRQLGLSPAIVRASTVPANVSSLDPGHLSTSALSVRSPNVSQLLSQNNQQQENATPNVLEQFISSASEGHGPVSVPLQVVHVNEINIPPKEPVYYSKSTQTQTSSSNSSSNSAAPNNDELGEIPPDGTQQKSYYGKQTTTTTTSNVQNNIQNQAANNSTPGATSINQLGLEWDDEFPVLTYEDNEDEHSSDFSNQITKSMSNSRAAPQAEIVKPTSGDEGDRASETMAELREMNDDERKQIELRDDYRSFVDRGCRILERALHQNESSEIFIQYFPDGGKDAIDSDKKSGNSLSLNRILLDERWSKDRCVTSFDWSAQHPELLLASYYTNDRSPSDPDGTVLIWNMKFKNTSPEYVFHCQSAIMSSCFAKFHPSLIVGGTYSGQIVLWDMRSNKKTPVQRSSLTTAAHTHPVYCGKVVGSQNAHNFISISTDGKLCSWSLDMLSAPQDTMELIQLKQTRSVAVTCMSFHPDDFNNFLVGSEEGVVYSACRHGAKTGILSHFEKGGHQGLVTSVDFRPIDTQPGYSHLFLTSSIDWTVKLWDTKQTEPIHTFESNNDYIYDVKWSPTNAALFATADGDGRVDLWNLANDSELPTASIQIEPVMNGDIRSQPSLNKLVWTPNGNQVVVGDDVGRIHVYDIGDVGQIGASRRQDDKWQLGDQLKM